MGSGRFDENGVFYEADFRNCVDRQDLTEAFNKFSLESPTSRVVRSELRLQGRPGDTRKAASIVIIIICKK